LSTTEKLGEPYLSAMLTPTIAVVGLYIAFNQKRIEESRLRHELFERRYRLFDTVMKFISSVIVSGNMIYDDEMKFVSDILGVRFIFDEEIEEIISNKILKSAREIQVLNETAPQVENAGERKIELKKHLMKQRDIFQEKTLKYMYLQQPSTLQKIRQYLPVLYEKMKKAAD
jgi:hypothetical protein